MHHVEPLKEDKLRQVISRLMKNFERMCSAPEVPLSEARPPKGAGVYMIFFEGGLQYVGSSGRLRDRIRGDLLRGDKTSHTLINKLCKSRNWSRDEVIDFLRKRATIKFIEVDDEYEAKLLEDLLIAIYRPRYNERP